MLLYAVYYQMNIELDVIDLGRRSAVYRARCYRMRRTCQLYYRAICYRTWRDSQLYIELYAIELGGTFSCMKS